MRSSVPVAFWTVRGRERASGEAEVSEDAARVALILRTLFLTLEEFEALPEDKRREELVAVLVAAGWAEADAVRTVAGFGAGELLERTAAALAHPPGAGAPDPVPSESGGAVGELLRLMHTDRAGWDGLGVEGQRAKAVSLLLGGGFSEAEATARVATFPDAEILERTAAAIAERMARVSPRTRASIASMARLGVEGDAVAVARPTAKKKSSGDALGLALGAILARALLG